jgi:hypothetical protein
MKILVDADACPNPIKEILYRAAKRLSIPMTLFANHPLTIAPSPFIKFVLVPKGFDVADNIIVERVEKGDLVITADIPLASATIEKGGFALNVRGEFYTEENIQQRLAMRNYMEELRSLGQRTGGPAPLNTKDHQDFANALDRFLAKSVGAK